ncbi:LOB domain-containing protein 16-like [Rhodamnia argentea]|uniref:LOB domain-containing protein 16-like n=1 Tax=Rhodamnia argentea TaxID=178133 RepID=A0A8B8QI71_9MYRT|nr:LOB domain-containing protein 16-like [Rhodamnia argentea]
MGPSGAGNGAAVSPCGACKFLRRKCAADCIFAPYFRTEQGPARFAAIHKVFGASNVSKLLLHVPVADRCEAVFTIAYEAQARLRDPVYGCVSHVFALQQQVAFLQAQLMQAKAQLAQNLTLDSINYNALMQNPHQQWWGDNNNVSGLQAFTTHHMMMMMSNSSASPTSSLESIDHSSNSNHSNGAAAMMVHRGETESNREDWYNYQELCFLRPSSSCAATKRPLNGDLSELQALAHTMMRNGS